MTDFYYTVEQFNEDFKLLCGYVVKKEYSSIYPVPRGGIVLAVAMAARLGVPIVTKPNPTTLIVDDLMDSGKTRSKFKDNDFICIHCKPWAQIQVSQGKDTYYLRKVKDWVHYWWEDQTKVDSLEDNITRILQSIGEDPNRAGLIDTPKRVAKMYKEFFAGYDLTRIPKIMTVKNGEDGVIYNEMLIDEGYFFSFCEHHVIPFFGQYYYGYIPNELIMGASKIGRTIDYYAGRLQIAERLVNQVVNRIDEVVKPNGQVLVMRARHLCKEMRGLKKWNSPFEAIAVRGCFANNLNGCKDEFMSRIQGGR